MIAKEGGFGVMYVSIPSWLRCCIAFHPHFALLFVFFCFLSIASFPRSFMYVQRLLGFNPDGIWCSFLSSDKLTLNSSTYLCTVTGLGRTRNL